MRFSFSEIRTLALVHGKIEQEFVAFDTVGMFARSDTPLTRPSQAMAKTLAAAGRRLAFSR